MHSSGCEGQLRPFLKYYLQTAQANPNLKWEKFQFKFVKSSSKLNEYFPEILHRGWCKSELNLANLWLNTGPVNEKF